MASSTAAAAGGLHGPPEDTRVQRGDMQVGDCAENTSGRQPEVEEGANTLDEEELENRGFCILENKDKELQDEEREDAQGSQIQQMEDRANATALLRIEETENEQMTQRGKHVHGPESNKEEQVLCFLKGAENGVPSVFMMVDKDKKDAIARLYETWAALSGEERGDVYGGGFRRYIKVQMVRKDGVGKERRRRWDY